MSKIKLPIEILNKIFDYVDNNLEIIPTTETEILETELKKVIINEIFIKINFKYDEIESSEFVGCIELPNKIIINREDDYSNVLIGHPVSSDIDSILDIVDILDFIVKIERGETFEFTIGYSKNLYIRFEYMDFKLRFYTEFYPEINKDDIPTQLQYSVYLFNKELRYIENPLIFLYKLLIGIRWIYSTNY